MKSGKCDFWKCSNRVGLALVVAFVICFFWYFVNPMGRELHMALFKLSYLGFSGMNFASFILGAVQTYIWGYIAVGIWHLVGCCAKGGSCER
jgi:hypothetical protein